MSAVVAAEELGLNSSIVVTDRAMSTEGISGNLKLNEVYSSGDLIKAMLVVSSNRAAMAIADSIGVLKFVDKMQMKANALGMTNTTFVEPTGLSFMNQGTVEDLEKLVRYIYQNHPELLETGRQKSVSLKELISGLSHELININTFVHTRPDYFGGKTGYTDQAGGNLITIFDHEGRKLLYIVLGTDDRFGQTEILSNWTFKAFSFN
jgi:D-alanyl-D-alanine carboxypeptidase